MTTARRHSVQNDAIDTNITNISTNSTAIALNTTHRSSDGSDHSKVGANETAIALNTTHRGSAGTDHSDVGLNNTHRGLTNEHLDWTASVGTIHADNYTDTDTTDHTALSNIGTNTHAQIDTAVTKIAGIEAGAEVNNISDANATDLTDGGDTTLHDHAGISENTTHRSSDGSDHSFINQNVTTTGTPTFGVTTLGDSSQLATSAAPTADADIANKKYIDDIAIAGVPDVLVPIGAVTAWLKSYTNTPQTLPAGWVECDGSVLDDAGSVYDGQTLPDLNGGEFLRGNTTSGGTGGSSTHAHELPFGVGGSSVMTNSTPTFGSGANFTANLGNSFSGISFSTPTYKSNTASSLPPSYDVVWIMRIK